jgi:hypothetical protein
MSHMLDCQMFGLQPPAITVNVALHAASGALFLALSSLTGRLGRRRSRPRSSPCTR